MSELLAYSERVVRAAIHALPDGRFEGADLIETADGLLDIRATATIADDSIDIDFDGTAPQYDGNLNCPLAVTRSACFYVVRCLTAPDLPASGGAFVPVTVCAPDGCLVNAHAPAAVAARPRMTTPRVAGPPRAGAILATETARSSTCRHAGRCPPSRIGSISIPAKRRLTPDIVHARNVIPDQEIIMRGFIR
jgi:hypothetical protein